MQSIYTCHRIPPHQNRRTHENSACAVGGKAHHSGLVYGLEYRNTLRRPLWGGLVVKHRRPAFSEKPKSNPRPASLARSNPRAGASPLPPRRTSDTRTKKEKNKTKENQQRKRGPVSFGPLDPPLLHLLRSGLKPLDPHLALLARHRGARDRVCGSLGDLGPSLPASGGRRSPPLGQLLLHRAHPRPGEVRASVVPALGHPVWARVAFLGLTPLDRTSVVRRGMLLLACAEHAPRGYSRAARTDMTRRAAPTAESILSLLLKGLDLIAAAQEPQTRLAEAGVSRLGLPQNRERNRRGCDPLR